MGAAGKVRYFCFVLLQISEKLFCLFLGISGSFLLYIVIMMMVTCLLILVKRVHIYSPCVKFIFSVRVSVSQLSFRSCFLYSLLTFFFLFCLFSLTK